MGKQPQVFGYATGIGGVHQHGCSKGPKTIKSSPYFPKVSCYQVIGRDLDINGPTAIPQIQKFCSQLAQMTQDAVASHDHFITLGGDHCCAIGSWSGAASAIGSLGLIWVDAHMDCHTPNTSHSGNTHGMPLATLLGHGDSRLTEIGLKSPKIEPENLCLVGIRSFEPEEQALLEKLGVKIYYMEEIKQRGIATVLNEAVQKVSADTNGFGISIDLDALDPHDAPGVGVPEENGIIADEFIAALKTLKNNDQLVGIDIAEFNPDFDVDKKTENIACQIMTTLFGENYEASY